MHFCFKRLYFCGPANNKKLQVLETLAMELFPMITILNEMCRQIQDVLQLHQIVRLWLKFCEHLERSRSNHLHKLKGPQFSKKDVGQTSPNNGISPRSRVSVVTRYRKNKDGTKTDKNFFSQKCTYHFPLDEAFQKEQYLK